MRELFFVRQFRFGNDRRIAAGIVLEFNLNPHPSEKRRVRHPESRGVAQRNFGVVGEGAPPAV